MAKVLSWSQEPRAYSATASSPPPAPSARPLPCPVTSLGADEGFRSRASAWFRPCPGGVQGVETGQGAAQKEAIRSAVRCDSAEIGPAGAGALDLVETRRGGNGEHAVPQPGGLLSLGGGRHVGPEEGDGVAARVRTGDGDDRASDVLADQGDSPAVGRSQLLVVTVRVAGVGQVQGQSGLTQRSFQRRPVLALLPQVMRVPQRGGMRCGVHVPEWPPGSHRRTGT